MIGAVLGLIVGWAEYKIVGGAIERRLRATDRSRTAAEKAEYERRIQSFRSLFLVFSLTSCLVVGYLLGHGIAS